MLKAAHAYLSTQVTTTTQGDLLVMLYDAAIKFLKQSKVKIDERNYAEKGILISRALDIISELAQSLNKEKGGELAQNLNQIYFFCSTQLAKANLKMDTKMIDEVIGLLSTLRGAYAQILPGYDGKDEQAEPAPSPQTMGAVSTAPSAPTPPPGGAYFTPTASPAAPQPASSYSRAQQHAPAAPGAPAAAEPPVPPISPMGSPAAVPVASAPVFAPGQPGQQGVPAASRVGQPPTAGYGPGVGFNLAQTPAAQPGKNQDTPKPNALRLRARNAYNSSV